MTDEEMWRKRFGMFLAVRLAGLSVIGLGMAVAFTDIAYRGGWRMGGAGLIVVGTVICAFGPLWLKKAWSRPE